MQKADIGASAANSHFVRIADLDGDRSEGPQAALHVEMCIAQHLSLSAQSGLSPLLPDAAVRPGAIAIRAGRSILVGGNVGMRTKLTLLLQV
jgi:hypothetical protein